MVGQEGSIVSVQMEEDTIQVKTHIYVKDYVFKGNHAFFTELFKVVKEQEELFKSMYPVKQ